MSRTWPVLIPCGWLSSPRSTTLPRSNCDQWTLGIVILYGNDELFIFMQFVIILKHGTTAEQSYPKDLTSPGRPEQTRAFGRPHACCYSSPPSTLVAAQYRYCTRTFVPWLSRFAPHAYPTPVCIALRPTRVPHSRLHRPASHELLECARHFFPLTPPLSMRAGLGSSDENEHAPSAGP
jgi:hypothetical protein